MYLTKFAFSILILGLWNIVTASNDTSAAETRIVGGQVTTISNVPYMVQVWKNGSFACGGALVAKNFVLCAAHCFRELDPANVVVVAGATNLMETGVRSKVQKLLLPAAWNPTTMYMDAAVLKLATPITTAAAKTVGFYRGKLNPGLEVRISGWGRVTEDGKMSRQIRTTRVPVVNRDQCVKQYQDVFTLQNTMFCAGVPGSKDACLGDSGGPAICKGKLCGIVSYGNGCARVGFPGIYTILNRALPFIKNAMKR
ncbi:seminase-like [Stomoxys calcitrans]|uniref:seminase-like n=1 Tax=Stomoxys calcitrans TaxID=35570 RepID=UPI0027E30C06|nr:seminase-like [Stomoxys calcitrans]